MNIVVFGFALARRWLKKVFMPAQNGFKYIYPQTVFKHLMFIILILYSSHLFYLTLFSTSRYSKLVSFMFYLVHSLSTWFTHSLISPLYRLCTVPAHSIRGGLLRTSFDYVIILVRHPLDCFSFMLIYYLSLPTSFGLHHFALSRFCKIIRYLICFLGLGMLLWLYDDNYYDGLLLGYPERDCGWLVL